MRPQRLRTVAAMLVVAVAFFSAGALPAPTLAQDQGGEGQNAGGGSTPTGSSSDTSTLTQLTQTVQSLVETVQQVVSVVGNLYSTATSLFSGGFSGLGGLTSGLSTSMFNASSWLSHLSQLAYTVLGQTGTSTWNEWGSEWGMAPDYSYSTGSIASQLEQIAASVSSVSGATGAWVSQMAARLMGAPAPQPYTPQSSATILASQDPDFASRAHAVQQSQVGATAAQATAQAAAQQAQDVATQATQDQTPHNALAAAAQTAQAAQGALMSAPSTRAAVEVLGTALTQQQVELAAQNAAISDRFDALLTQQAQIALELSNAVAGVGVTTGVLAQQAEQQLEAEAQGDQAIQETTAGSASGLVGELNFIAQGGNSSGLDQFLSTHITGP